MQNEGKEWCHKIQMQCWNNILNRCFDIVIQLKKIHWKAVKLPLHKLWNVEK